MGLPLKVSVLHKLDSRVFPLVCFALTVLRKTLARTSSCKTSQIKSILFVKLAEQGSSVLAIPAIQEAASMVGRENLYALVFKENRFILDIIGIIPPENILTVDHGSLLAMVRSTIYQIFKIRKLHVDAAVDLEFFARFSAAITYLTGAKWRVGLHAYFGEGPYRGDLMTHRVLYNAQLHTSQMFMSLVKAMQLDPKTLPTFPYQPEEMKTEMVFQPTEEEVERVKNIIIKESGLESIPKIVLMNPNASDLLPFRKWDLENYKVLARLILDNYPEVRIGITGSPEESEKAQNLCTEIGSERCFSFAGKTSLRELMVLYNLCTLLVTNDSGPAHFASLTSIKVITLFGPETPRLFAALTPRSFPITAKIACSPCVNALNNRQSSCIDNQCMKMISPEIVFNKIQECIV